MANVQFPNYLFAENPWPGKLIVFDGMKRSGKSTIVDQVRVFLVEQGIPVVSTEWNSYPSIQPLIDRKKEEKSFTPLTWFGLHYVDFLLRYEEVIRPALTAGKWVIADRYIYTAFSRDYLKGIDHNFIYEAYRFAVKPDLVFFFITPPELVLQRHLLKTDTFHPYNSGLDIFGTAGDTFTIYQRYHESLREQYLLMKDLCQAFIIDGQQPIEENAKIVKEVIAKAFPQSPPNQTD